MYFHHYCTGFLFWDYSENPWLKTQCFRCVCVPFTTLTRIWCLVMWSLEVSIHIYTLGGGGKLPLYRFLIETVLPQLGKAGEIWFHSLISPPRDGVVSSRRLAGLLTPGWPPGVNKGERSWGLCQTFCRIFALSQGRKGSASDSKVGGPQWDSTEGGSGGTCVTVLETTEVPVDTWSSQIPTSIFP